MMKAVMRDAKELNNSKFEWVGKFPFTWQLVPLHTVSEIKGRIGYRGYTVADLVEQGEGPITLSPTNIINEKICLDKCSYLSWEKYYESPEIMVNKGDIVFVKTASVGKCAIYESDDLATINPQFVVIKKFKINNRFLYYSLISDVVQTQVKLDLVGGVMKTITQTELSRYKILLPTKKEQEIIANYLDDRCSKIDAIIAEAKASIEEYKELKQAVITQAVTLGPKKERQFKDTNIPWIGKAPCDWQVAELKFFASIKSGITLGQKYPQGTELIEMPYLRVANVQGEYVDLSDVKTIQVMPEEVKKYSLEVGVVLMTEGGDRDKLGRGCVWHGEIEPCLHQNHIFAVSTKADKLLPEYFSHVTTSEVARCYFDYTAKKTTNLANTNSSTIMNFRLPIPPLKEQREIVHYLDKRIKTLNDMISEKQSLIEDLEAYKKSLIYEVVTGKRKVVA